MFTTRVRPRGLPDGRWEFAFSGPLTVGTHRPTVTGNLVLGGRTQIGEAVRGFEGSPVGQVAGIFGGMVRLVPFAGPLAGDVVSYAGKELFGTDGPPTVGFCGKVADVQLSRSNQRDEMSGAVDLGGTGRLTVRGLPTDGLVMLRLESLR